MKNKLLNIIGIVAVIVACVAAHHFTKQRKVIMDSGIQMANMDTTVRAGDDFYDFATRIVRIPVMIFSVARAARDSGRI